MEQTSEAKQISEIVESYVTPLRKQITEMLIEIEALKQASFILSKQDVIKSVCECLEPIPMKTFIGGLYACRVCEKQIK